MANIARYCLDCLHYIAECRGINANEYSTKNRPVCYESISNNTKRYKYNNETDDISNIYYQ